MSTKTTLGVRAGLSLTSLQIEMFLFYSQSRSNCNVGFWILMEVYYTGGLFADAKFPPMSSIAI